MELGEEEPKLTKAYRTAIIFSAVPLLVGIAIFLLWLVTRWDWLMLAGAYTLSGGLAFLGVSLIALCIFIYRAIRNPVFPRRRIGLQVIACIALMLLNFLVAAGIVSAAIAIEFRYTVVVINASEKTLDHVRVFGGGCNVSFGSIPPGKQARKTMEFSQDDRLEFRAESGKTVYEKIVDGYVTGGMGGHLVVTVNPDGTISDDRSR